LLTGVKVYQKKCHFPLQGVTGIIVQSCLQKCPIKESSKVTEENVMDGTKDP